MSTATVEAPMTEAPTENIENTSETPVANPPKRRGRPPGSKNKPKTATIEVRKPRQNRTATRTTTAVPSSAVEAKVVLIEKSGDRASVMIIDETGKQYVFQSAMSTVLDRR